MSGYMTTNNWSPRENYDKRMLVGEKQGHKNKSESGQKCLSGRVVSCRVMCYVVSCCVVFVSSVHLLTAFKFCHFILHQSTEFWHYFYRFDVESVVRFSVIYKRRHAHKVPVWGHNNSSDAHVLCMLCFGLWVAVICVSVSVIYCSNNTFCCFFSCTHLMTQNQFSLCSYLLLDQFCHTPSQASQGRSQHSR